MTSITQYISAAIILAVLSGGLALGAVTDMTRELQLEFRAEYSIYGTVSLELGKFDHEQEQLRGINGSIRLTYYWARSR